MKVVAFNGSARKDGNTAILLNIVLDEIRAEGIDTEIIQLAGTPLQGCIACYKWFERKNRRCAVEKDAMNDHIAKMLDADGILIGSPTYFSDVSASMKALIERCGMVARANDDMFRRKVREVVLDLVVGHRGLADTRLAALVGELHACIAARRSEAGGCE